MESDDSSDGEQRLLSLEPIDPVDDEHLPARRKAKTSLSDFDFLPRELKLITDAGPGESDIGRKGWNTKID